jgi:hypothetical protein
MNGGNAIEDWTMGDYIVKNKINEHAIIEARRNQAPSELMFGERPSLTMHQERWQVSLGQSKVC